MKIKFILGLILLVLIITIASGLIDIKINNAEHLDSDRNIVSEIYTYVNETDGIVYTIPEGEYARAYFEQELTNENVIDIFVRNKEPATIEIYEKDKNILVG